MQYTTFLRKQSSNLKKERLISTGRLPTYYAASIRFIFRCYDIAHGSIHTLRFLQVGYGIDKDSIEIFRSLFLRVLVHIYRTTFYLQESLLFLVVCVFVRLVRSHSFFNIFHTCKCLMIIWHIITAKEAN
jgi:hypothetical protein